MQLAIEIVRDGEGAVRVGRIEVSEAASPAEAERVARAIANSPLVKTALFGRDPNWGRIAQAAGAALAGEDLEEIGADSIDAAELAPRRAEAEIGLRLGRGEHARPRLVLRPRLRVRADQRGVHDLSHDGGAPMTSRHRSRGRPEPASRRCSRRCPTSASSTAARW